MEEARNAPPMLADAAKPPTPPKPVNFNDQVNIVVNTKNVTTTTVNNVTVVKPNTWQYLGYEGTQPFFYNPYSGPVYVKYFYGGDYRMLWVPAAARVLMDVATAAAYPFTVVGDDFVSSGYFNGDGYVPPVYDNVNVYLPAYDQSVLVDQVTYVGHDDARPAGEQDSFMLNDSTLAWGTKTDDGNITLTRTQTTPGVGPTDDGGSIIHEPVALVAHEDHTWQWLASGGAVFATVLGTASVLAVRRRRRFVL